MKKLIFSTVLASLFIFNAQAQEEDIPDDDYSKWQLRIRAIAVSPAPYFYDAISGFKPDISTAFAPEVDITYFLSKNIALELMLTTSNHDVEIKDEANLGSVSLLPPTLSLQYHFDLDDFKPYIGAGLNYTIFYGEDAGDLDAISYKNEIGYALQAGIDYNLNDKWFINLDLKKIFLKTEVTPNNDNASKVEANLDPLIMGFGVGMKF
ncbi:OmpW/AlkL family protein [Psychroserpens mesophilus]|uniref:OmpW/AlkL family protein n=1 Tax=Psychroserpens mesophilus TaxID=325473 RepID=UPI003F496D55